MHKRNITWIIYKMYVKFEKQAKVTSIATFLRFAPFCYISTCKLGVTSARRCTRDV